MSSDPMRRRRREAVFFGVLFVLLVFVLALSWGGVAELPVATRALDPLSEQRFTPLSQALALLFWLALTIVLGLTFARALLRSVSVMATYAVGAALAAASLPLMQTLVQSVLRAFASSGALPPVVVRGIPDAYALIALFALLLVGVLLLIGREVIRAAFTASPHARTA